MTKLKLGPIVEDKPVKFTVELPAPLHRDLVVCGDYLKINMSMSNGQEVKYAGIEAWPFAEGGCGAFDDHVAGAAEGGARSVCGRA